MNQDNQHNLLFYVPILVLVLVIIAVLHFLAYDQYQHKINTDSDHLSDNQMSLLSDLSQRYIVNNELKQLSLLHNYFLKNHDMHALVIENHLTGEQLGDFNLNSLPSYNEKLTYPLFLSGKQVGLITVIYDHQHTQKSLRQVSYLVIGSFLLLAFIIVLIAWFLYRRHLSKQLLRDREKLHLQHIIDEQQYAIDQHAIIAITDVKGVITYVNDKFCQISGYSKSELLGQNHRILNSDNQPKSYWKAMYATVVSGHVWNDEVRNIAKDGHCYWLDVTIVPFMGENNKPESYVSIRTDITEKKQAEILLKRHQEDLEMTVFERTQEAKNAQKIAEVALYQLEQANREKGRFLSNMSHELRTPMHAILNFTDMALNKSNDEKQIRFLNNVLISSNRLMDLLDNLLDLSDLEEGMIEPNFSKHDLTVLAQQSVIKVQRLIKDKELTIAVNTEEPLEGVFDLNLMNQVIVNILSNAIKFSPVGGLIRIDIEASDQWLIDREQKTLHIIITDQGIGIPEEDAEAVFDKFVQSSKTIMQSGGTGLGLPIAKEIINAHKGHIYVAISSDEDSTDGAAIHIIIPVEQNPGV